MNELTKSSATRGFNQMKRHRHVGIEVATRIRLVGTYATDFCGEVNHHIGAGVSIETFHGGFSREVVIALSHNEWIGHSALAQHL
jgi:hypothetical protein